MSSQHSPRIDHHFASLTDPRRGKLTHPLINIVAIALCAAIAGADEFVAMAHWARLHQDWLGQFLDLSHGIPSHDRLNMVFRRLKPAEFERCLLSWLDSLHDAGAGRLLAIDGKTARHSFDTAGAKSALHMVSVWAVSQRLSVGCVAVDKKSNEITAVPEVLKLVELCGAIVTIDAMGCQTEIARQIVEGGADYILAVQGNQPTLHDGIEDHFLEQMEDDFAGTSVSRHETTESGHGRQEHRTYDVLDVPEGLPDAKRWKGLKQIGMAISDTVRDGKPCDDVRYFILSRKMSARRFGTLIRSRWGIENSLHWQLDMSFGEDQKPDPKGAWRGEPCGVATGGAEFAEERGQSEGRDQEQATHRGVEYRLFTQGAVRVRVYGAIALADLSGDCTPRLQVSSLSSGAGEQRLDVGPEGFPSIAFGG